LNKTATPLPNPAAFQAATGLGAPAVRRLVATHRLPHPDDAAWSDGTVALLDAAGLRAWLDRPAGTLPMSLPPPVSARPLFWLLHEVATWSRADQSPGRF
jgi:hypothetical protein